MNLGLANKYREEFIRTWFDDLRRNPASPRDRRWRQVVDEAGLADRLGMDVHRPRSTHAPQIGEPISDWRTSLSSASSG
jgi:hypothetical protein